MFYDEKHLIAMDSIEIKNRFEGCLYGQAVGDANYLDEIDHIGYTPTRRY
jgi:hypothetical protein